MPKDSTIHVVVDTSLVSLGRYPWQDTRWRGLLIAARRGSAVIHLPAATRAELDRHARDEVATQMAKIRSAKSRLERLFRLDLPITVPSAESIWGRIEEDTATQIAANSVREHAAPDIPHEDLLSRYRNNRRPFAVRKKGHAVTGYRDTLIWETARKLAASGELVHLLTANTSDFGEPGDLHPDLRADLKADGLAEASVVVVTSLEELPLPTIRTPDDGEVTELVTADLLSAILTAAASVTNWAGPGLSLPHGQFGQLVTVSLRSLEVRAAFEDENYEVEAQWDAVIELAEPDTAVEAAGSGAEISREPWDLTFMLQSGERTITLRFTALGLVSGDAVEDLEYTRVEAVERSLGTITEPKDLSILLPSGEVSTSKAVVREVRGHVDFWAPRKLILETLARMTEGAKAQDEQP